MVSMKSPCFSQQKSLQQNNFKASFTWNINSNRETLKNNIPYMKPRNEP